MAPTSAASRLERLPSIERRVLAHNQKLCQGWLEWLRDHGRAKVTVYQYGAKCDELLEFLGDTPLDLATLDQLEAWVARPRRGRGKGNLGADATRAKDTLVLRGLFRWAVDHGKLASNPAAKLELPSVKNEDPRAIDVDDWRAFWSSPTLDDEERVAYGLGFFCGLRRAEVCKLESRHWNAKLGRIDDFPRKGDRSNKTSGSVPVVSLARFFAQEHPKLLGSADDFLGPLTALVEARSGSRWLLPWGERAVTMPVAWRGGSRPVPDGATSPDQINHHLKRALRTAGLDDTLFTPHALRHSFVTYLLRAGVKLEVVSKLANHSNVNITMRYLKIADDPIEALLKDDPDDGGTTTLKGSRW